MKNVLLSDLVVPLNRPEYPSSPEIFLTSIAWAAFEIPGFKSDAKRRFKRHQRDSETKNSSSRQGAYEYAWDYLSSTSSGFAQNLQQQGFTWARAGTPGASQLSSEFTRALLSGLTGSTSEKSNSVSAAPIIPSVALMQTVPGMKGTSANFAGIFEQIARIGAPQSNSIAEGWVKATQKIADSSSFLTALDAAIDSTEGYGPRRRRTNAGVSSPWAIAEASPELVSMSPFGWFMRAWTNLTSDAWVEALPPRVWCDWASSLLRTSFGFVYLWEAAWYHRIAAITLSQEQAPLNEMFDPLGDLLPWLPDDLPISLRGVKGFIDKTVRTGGEISSVLSKELKASGLQSEPLASGIQALRSDPAFLKRLSDAKNQATARQTSTVEAVTYSLNVRKEFGEGADYFGLLSERSRRFRVPDPGSEWLAMVVSLCSPVPDAKVNMGKLVSELNSMGLNPPTGELVRDLEKAGLARGSADSDFGMEIETAF